MASEHGGLNYTKLRAEGVNPDDVLDFSVSINPDPLPPSVLDAVHESRITRYPDSGCLFLREKVAEFNDVDTDEVLVVNGTSQGMFLIVSSLLKEKQPVCIVEPTYSEYKDACKLKTENIIDIDMSETDNFSFQTNQIISAVEVEKPVLLWLCSPNNPTGRYLEENDFEQIRQVCIRNNTILILDEAYVCFVPSEKRYNPLRKNVIVLRSMTKDFSIPGLRLGYLLAETGLIETIKRWQPEWSISSPAQDAGVAGYAAISYYENSWFRTVQRRDKMMTELASLGLKVYESCSNFFLVEVDNVDALKSALWKNLILIRDCRSFNLKNTIRIGVRTETENQKLISSIREYLNK